MTLKWLKIKREKFIFNKLDTTEDRDHWLLEYKGCGKMSTKINQYHTSQPKPVYLLFYMLR